MTGRLTPEIVAGLRETLIALGTRDAHRLVLAYQQLGILLPGADLHRIEDATRAAFDRVWGLNMSELSRMPFAEMASLGREFSDLLFALPFQVPQDFLYLARAVGILSGICTGLDPTIDPWHEMQPFVRSLLIGNDGGHDRLRSPALRGLLTSLVMDAGLEAARRTIQLPALADDVLRRANRGDLVVRVEAAADTQRQLGQIEHATQRLSAAVVFAGLAVSSAVIYMAGEPLLSAAGFALAGVALLKVLLAKTGD
jgi:predicted unusual protein kinase regulating ubiquinone biosynthesis (AarF/ABC1/UbiB family)